ncbi:MAG: 4Fe-4S binding protein [Candidatus Ranarchaeia archaeon]
MSKTAKKDDDKTPISKPSPGSMGKTGDWRTYRPEIDYNKCIRCKLCWLYCPEGSIKWVNNQPVIDYKYCKGCGICWKQCNSKAIEWKKESRK